MIPAPQDTFSHCSRQWILIRAVTLIFSWPWPLTSLWKERISSRGSIKYYSISETVHTFLLVCKNKLSCCVSCKNAPFRNMSARNNMSGVQNCKHRNTYLEVVICKTRPKCAFCSAGEEWSCPWNRSCQCFNTTSGWQKGLWGEVMLIWVMRKSTTGGWECGRTIIGM